MVALMYLTSPFKGLFTPSNEVAARSDTLLSLIQALIYSITLIFVLPHSRAFLRGMFEAKWIFILVLFTLISAAWAGDASLSIRRGLIAAATTCFGVYFGSRYNRDNQVTLLCYAISAILLMSVAMVILYPEFGLFAVEDGSDWRGIFETKNMLGRVMATGIVAFLCVPSKYFGMFGRLLCLSAAGAVIAFSGSATAAVVAGVMIVLVWLMKSLRAGRFAFLSVLMFSLAMFTVAVVVVVFNRSFLLSSMHRDETLGRLPVWLSALTAISARPLLGYGFSSFWNGPESAALVRTVGWVPPHAHNGFLDICLDLGMGGLLIFATGFVLKLRRVVSEYRAGGQTVSWSLAFLLFLLLYNVSESTLLQPNSLFWALYTAVLSR